MRRLRFAFLAPTLAAACLLPLAAAAIEVPALRLDSSLRAARVVEPPPLRLAASLSVEPLARLEPAAVAATAELAAMAAYNERNGRPYQVGFPRSLLSPLTLTIDPAAFPLRLGERVGGGFLARERGGDYVWGTSVEVAGAQALRLELSAVNLPAGTRFWVYGDDGQAVPFDLRLVDDSRTIHSPVIDGERIHLEVLVPEGRLDAGQGFAIRRVQELTVGRSHRNGLTPLADSCLQNGECFDSGDFPGIEDARDSAIQYIFTDGGTFLCSATLLNDTVAATFEPWILTANHCVSTQNVAQSMNMFFFYRRTGCGSSSFDRSDPVIGADLIVTTAPEGDENVPDGTDMTLVRAIDGDAIPSGAVFAGWTSARPSHGTILHRISHPSNGAAPGVYTQMYSKHQVDTTPAFDCSGAGASFQEYLYTENLDGTGISGGSSGSAVMRADGLVVGQLLGSCGSPSNGCGTDENTLDGAFSESFSLLQPFLAPAGGACIPDADTACLLNGRFKVEVTWQTSSSTGSAQVMSFNGQRAETNDSVFFWFFGPTNFEMGVKMVDACTPPFNRFWAFVSGLTSQGFVVRITQMSTGDFQVYTNDVNEIPTTVADTNAFDCP